MEKIIININFHFFLIKFYKHLLLNDLDVIVIFAIKYLLDCNEKVITPEVISIVTNMSSSKIDEIFLKLINKKYISYDREKEIFSLNLLENKLAQLFCIYINKKNFLKSDKKSINEIESIVSMFKQKFSRNILDIEYSLICEWVSNNFTVEECKKALELAEEKNSLTFRTIDDILMNKIN